MAGVYANTNNITPGNLIQSTDVKTPIDNLDTIVAQIITGLINHAKVVVTGSYHFATAAVVTVTPVNGVISILTLVNKLETEGAASADDIDRINLGSSPGIFILKNNNAARELTLRHGIAGGNIQTSTGGHFKLSGLGGSALVLHDGTTAFVVGYDNQHSHSSSQISDLQSFVDARINAIVSGGVTFVYATDVSVVAGETLNERDFCFVHSDGKAYKCDSGTYSTTYGGANLHIRYGENYGFNITAGSTAAGGTITLRTSGEVGGFTGLTPNTQVFIGSSGAISASSPFVGVIMSPGWVKNSTTIVVVPGEKATFGRGANTLYPGDQIRINHTDRRYRPARFTVRASNADKTAITMKKGRAAYGLDLRVATAQTAVSLSTATGGTASVEVGRSGGIQYDRAQTFRPVATATYSRLKQVTLNFGTNVGTPVGKMIARLTGITSPAATGLPNTTILASSAPFAPVSAGSLVVPFPDAPILQNNTWYAITIECEQSQADGSYWTLAGTAATTYADGQAARRLNGAAWAVSAGVLDFQMTIDTVTMPVRSNVAQMFTPSRNFSAAQVDVFLNRSGVFAASTTTGIQAHIYASSGGVPSGSPLASSQMITVSELALATGTLALQNASGGLSILNDYTQVPFYFANPLSLTAGVPYHIVISSNALASSALYMKLLATDAALAGVPGASQLGAVNYSDAGAWSTDPGVGGTAPTALIFNLYASIAQVTQVEAPASQFSILDGVYELASSSQLATTLVYNGTEILSNAIAYMTL